MFNIRRILMLLVSYLVILLFVLQPMTFAGGGQGTGTAPLSNDEVMKMVQAKLPDAVIVAKVKSSTCKFDTSTDALIGLKSAGVSDAVLEAMAGCGAAAAPVAAPPASAPP